MIDQVPPLLALRSIPVPDAALQHYNVHEASCCVQVLRKSEDRLVGGVIGTKNTKRAELYGWANPVGRHVDGKGNARFIYGLLLSGECRVATDTHTIDLEPGDVFRLNDREPHWTEGAENSVSIFVGDWAGPCDDKACTILERGLRRLAAGVYQAPRAREGFRVRQEGEVYASLSGGDYRMVSASVAKRLDLWVLNCCVCEEPADRIDNHFPYFQEHYCNACDQA